MTACYPVIAGRCLSLIAPRSSSLAVPTGTATPPPGAMFSCNGNPMRAPRAGRVAPGPHNHHLHLLTFDSPHTGSCTACRGYHGSRRSQRGDLNSRPPGSRPGALPNCATPSCIRSQLCLTAHGADGWTRTSDLLLRGETFCPRTELHQRGADRGSRTPSLPLTRRSLNQLSYIGLGNGGGEKKCGVSLSPLRSISGEASGLRLDQGDYRNSWCG